MIWGCRILFNLGQDQTDLIEQVTDWLAERDVLNSIEISIDSDDVGYLSVLLPADRAADAVLLSFWPGCREVSRI